MYYRNKNHFKIIFCQCSFTNQLPGIYSPYPPLPPKKNPNQTNKQGNIVNMHIFIADISITDFSCYSSRFMIKIAEPGTNSKEFFKWHFSNFTASPLTEKSHHGYIEDKVYFIALRGRSGHDHMVVGFTTTYTISVYHH